MKRLAISMMVVGLGLGLVAGRASAGASPIATAMGDLRWGLSEDEVTSYAQRSLTEHYNNVIAKVKEPGKQGTLRAELKKNTSQIAKSRVSFETKSAQWDNSPIAGEFNYDNNESMLIAKSNDSTTYYFFVSDKLWKVVTVLAPGTVGGDFKKFSSVMESKYGKGRAKKGELTPGQGDTQWLEYIDRNSRMRAADNNAKRGGFALIYEEMATVRELASLRPKKSAKVHDDEETASAPAREAPAQIAKAPANKRSVFGNERQNESESDYQTRKQKAAVEARDRAQRAQARKEEQKKGEVLKQLDNVNDSDPLGGL